MGQTNFILSWCFYLSIIFSFHFYTSANVKYLVIWPVTCKWKWHVMFVRRCENFLCLGEDRIFVTGNLKYIKKYNNYSWQQTNVFLVKSHVTSFSKNYHLCSSHSSHWTLPIILKYCIYYVKTCHGSAANVCISVLAELCLTMTGRGTAVCPAKAWASPTATSSMSSTPRMTSGGRPGWSHLTGKASRLASSRARKGTPTFSFLGRAMNTGSQWSPVTVFIYAFVFHLLQGWKEGAGPVKNSQVPCQDRHDWVQQGKCCSSSNSRGCCGDGQSPFAERELQADTLGHK